MAASIATEINIHSCKHLFTLLCLTVSPWTSPFVVKVHDDRVSTWCVWLPWISRSVCTIRRPCWRTAWRQWNRSMEGHMTPTWHRWWHQQTTCRGSDCSLCCGAPPGPGRRGSPPLTAGMISHQWCGQNQSHTASPTRQRYKATKWLFTPRYPRFMGCLCSFSISWTPPPALWETDRNRNPPSLNIAGIGNNLLLLKYPL